MINLEKGELGRLIISILLYIISLFISNEIAKFYLCFFAYIFLIYDVFFVAFKNRFLKKQHMEKMLLLFTFLIIIFESIYTVYYILISYRILIFIKDIYINYLKKLIEKEIDFRTDYVNIYINDVVKKVIPESVRVDDIVIVYKGERIPLDGVVIKGSSKIDTSMITGNKMLIDITRKDEVISGCINVEEDIEIQVTSEYKDSTSKRIVEFMQNTVTKKSNLEKKINKYSNYYVYLIIIFSLIYLVFNNFNFYKSIMIFFISFPSTFILSYITAYLSGITVSTKEGILIKEKKDLEALVNIKTVIFDKTGTLTEGEFEVDKVVPNKISKVKFIKYLAYAESLSSHMIAKPIVDLYKGKIERRKIKNFTEIESRGIKVKIDNKQVTVGNYMLMEEEKIKIPKVKELGTIIFAAIEKKYIGYVVVSDEIKTEVKTLKQKLNDLGVKDIAIVSGDNLNNARDLAKKLGIKDYYYDLLPEEKVDVVNEYKDKLFKNEKIVFVGDGENDAEALIDANIGISTGCKWSSEALEASNVVILEDDPSKLINAIEIAKITLKTFRINILVSILIKVLLITLAIFNIINILVVLIVDIVISIFILINSGIIILKRQEI
ncbi:MAG TPA: heavy metal translocating P-type ATPase [Bacilli bacterium]|nr:heavy metal translocating P-type ATPase [Bacilli bacterium]